MKKRIISTILLSSFLVSSLSGCSFASDEQTATKSGYYFDTIITVTLYGTDDQSPIDDCFELAKQYEDLLSNTIEGSDISNINEHPNEFVTVDDKTIEVLEDALYYCRLSDGAFDITIGGLTDLWNISDLSENADDDNIISSELLPSDEEIKEELSHVNYQNVIIEGNSVKLTDDMAKLDLGGIAKGYIADQMKELLNGMGYSQGVINLGGNLLTLGPKDDGDSYHMGIQEPFADSGQIACSVDVADGTLVTSGIYERYIIADDQFYHHILDTQTGYPAETDLYSVTIICNNSAEADALSTYALILGKDKGKAFIENTEGLEAIFIDDQYNITYTSGLEGLVHISEDQ